MLTGTSPRSTNAREFILRAIAWGLGIFGLLRLNWIEAHVVLPATRWQGGLAVGLFGTPSLPVEATLACSGADALALCVGAILAYPVRWHSRAVAAAAGIVLILGLNTLRIGTLGLVASSPQWFNVLHLYVWPAVLTLAIAGYVFSWMHVADRPRESSSTARVQPSRRFIGLTVAFVLVFTVSSPVYLDSPAVLALAGFIARAAASILGGVGVSAHATTNELWTQSGGFVVTQECISTPLIPLYLAAVCAYSTNARRLVIGVLAALPLFTALGIVRLLLVALPDVVGPPIFFVHAFYQVLLGIVVVCLAAVWRHGRTGAPGRALAGIAAGVLFVYLVGPLYTAIVTYGAAPLDDPQGAIRILPAFQTGLYLALSVATLVTVGWWPLLAGFAGLALTQAAGLLVLHVIASQSDLLIHVRDIRSWAVAGPVLIFAAVVNGARARR